MFIKLNKTHLIITILLFIIEVLIAIFLKTGFIRHTVGDFLVVILIYCFFKSFLEVNALKLAISVFLFALFIELLQLLNVLSLLNMEHNKTAILLLGSTFQISDLLAYALGVITIIIIDVKIKDIQLPENMKRMMANQAEAERSRRARIILALAEEQAAGKLLEAGKLIDQSPSAIKLRLYQTLSNIAAEKNSTILFPFPEEVLPRNKKE